MSRILLQHSETRALRANRRREVRKPAAGTGWMELVDVAMRLEFKLVDTSPSGFCVRHRYGALSAGQRVRFQHEHAQGSAVVIWNRVLGDDVKSGFLIVTDGK